MQQHLYVQLTFLRLIIVIQALLMRMIDELIERNVYIIGFLYSIEMDFIRCNDNGSIRVMYEYHFLI